MQNVFEIVIKKALEVGFYDLLIFVFALTLFYAMLKKFKILGESPTINAIIAFTMAFFIFGYPVLVGYSLTMPLTKFFASSMIYILLFFMGVLISSFFYPDLPKFLSKTFTSRTFIWVAGFLVLLSIVTSGMLNVLWESATIEGNIQAPADVSFIAAGIIVFLLVVLIAASVAVSS